MKLCTRFFEHAYINPKGDVRICSWNDMVIGNLLTDTLDDIWNSDNRKRLLEGLLKGERYKCREHDCPYCINNELIEMSNDEIRDMWYKSKQPAEINCAFDYRCNHACPSCRKKIYVPDQAYLDKMKTITDRLGKILPKAKRIILSGSGDLFVNPETIHMLEELKPENPDFRIDIETNGTLVKKNWSRISHLAKYIKCITVTVNSYNRRTYAYLAGKDNFDLLKENMEFLSDLKEKYEFELWVTMVVQDSNFREIPDFIDTSLNTYHADCVVLRPIFMWFQISKEEWWYKNVQNPAHIYHNEYLEIIKDPICSDPRVMHWGTKDDVEPVTLADIFREQKTHS